MTTHVQRLLAHLRWSDERVQRALEVAGSVAPASAIELYAHVVGAEEVWLARLRGVEPRLPVWPALSVEGIRNESAVVHAALDAYAARLDADALRAEVTYVNSAGEAFTSTVEDVLLHVALHGSYHRGQVALLVRTAGAPPATTDYIAWARGAPAATRAS